MQKTRFGGATDRTKKVSQVAVAAKQPVLVMRYYSIKIDC